MRVMREPRSLLGRHKCPKMPQTWCRDDKLPGYYPVLEYQLIIPHRYNARQHMPHKYQDSLKWIRDILKMTWIKPTIATGSIVNNGLRLFELATRRIQIKWNRRSLEAFMALDTCSKAHNTDQSIWGYNAITMPSQFWDLPSFEGIGP